MTKYRAIPTTVHGIQFASKAESRRYMELWLLQKAGKIRFLQLQPPYPIVVNNIKVCTYVADFIYFDTEKNISVIEDVKGVQTPVYKLKKKLMLAVLGLTITEIT